MIVIETCPRCGHDLLDVVVDTMPPIPRKECPNCGWSWEGRPEEVVRVPFGGNMPLEDVTVERNSPIQPSDAFYEQSPCKYCGNHPSNGGSGTCHCILGTLAWGY